MRITKGKINHIKKFLIVTKLDAINLGGLGWESEQAQEIERIS